MTIIDNVITFERADIDALSAETQAALASYDTALTSAESLSGAVNSFITAVTRQAPVRSLNRLQAALKNAPPDKRAQANAKLDEIKEILDPK